MGSAAPNVQEVVDDVLTVALLRKPSALYFQFTLPLSETLLLLHDATFLLTRTLAAAAVIVAFVPALITAFCAAALALIIMIFATGIFAPAIAQSRPRIIVQSFGGLFEKTLREGVIPNFEKETGIDVTLTIEDDTTILPKLRAARSRAPYDVVTVDNNIAILGGEMGLWAPDQSAQMPNAGAIYKSSMPPMTGNYGSIVYEYALVYNSKKMPAPTSWNALWADGIVAGVPHITQSYGMTFLYMASILNGGTAANLDAGSQDLFGVCWQWTESAYRPYPGFRPVAGAIGEYNGKFMINTMVLRGSCSYTPDGHARPTYRNFFSPHTRWHRSGVRLASDR